MANDQQPEIIPPGSSPRRSGTRGSVHVSVGGQPPTDENLDHLATILDEVFAIPGTRIRFGLDALLGLIPGLGDAISGLVSSFIIFSAYQRGLPRVTIARMVANVMIDSVVGAIPLLGDLFDVAWKSNRKNVELLKRDTAAHAGHPHANTWKDAAFLVGAIIIVIAAVALPVLGIIWLVRQLW